MYTLQPQVTERVELADRDQWLKTGPWQLEPDRVLWGYESMLCLALRNDLGTWCGYVGVTPDHPWHPWWHTRSASVTVQVHGGLTFSGLCGGNRCCDKCAAGAHSGVPGRKPGRTATSTKGSGRCLRNWHHTIYRLARYCCA